MSQATGQLVAHEAVDSVDSFARRRVLEDVSPNVRKQMPAGSLLGRKLMTGSPLKRSFNASIENGEGLMYLKKRKLSDDQLLSDMGSPRRSMFDSEGGSLGNVAKFRAFLQPDETDPLLALPIGDASPTEPNTPSEHESTQESSAERKSFSSLINYDPSSQSSNLASQNTTTRAETLRLRLQMAMYKIRTNQTHVPFSELRVEPKKPRPSTNKVVEEAVAALRREAQQQMKTQILAPVPKLLPGPALRPTGYSSRMIYAPSPISSSPPLLRSPERLPLVTSLTVTPRRALGLQNLGTPGTADRFRKGAEQELTSSVVKGRVAEGLLGLRNAV